MGTFFAEALLAAPQRPERREPVKLLVDSGSTYTWIAAARLRALAVVPSERRRAVTIEGQVVERDAAEVLMSLENYLPTAKRVEVLARLCAEGYASKMVLSHDANCWTDMLSEEDGRRTRPLWHYTHISDDILPALRTAGVSEDQIEQMLVRNPRAIFDPQ